MSAALAVAPLLDGVAGDAAESALDDALSVVSCAEDGPVTGVAPSADVTADAAVADRSLPADEASCAAAATVSEICIRSR
jgi:hypothetical protein